MATPEHPTILNVDDDEACRYAVTRLLERSNFRVSEANSGREALEMAAEQQPDLVLLDVNLPDMDGFEVCRRLKQEPSTARIPVLHITASCVNGADMARGLNSGAYSYLIEPVEPEVLVATINSILRARRAEEEARSLARAWEATFEAIADGVALVDASGRIQRVNNSLGRLIGRTRPELIGMICYELWGNVARESIPFLRTVESRQRESVEIDYRARRLSVTADPMLDEKGAHSGAVLLVSDITEKRRLEAQFRESQKFETIGTLAAGVAHDFNNLLTSVMGNASLVLSDLPPDSDLREKLDDVVRAAERAADLTRQLLAYSGKGRHYLQKVDLSSLVRNIQNLIEAAIPKKVTLTLNLAPQLPRIEADANQLQQLILNLVSNAAEAIGDSVGDIAIRTAMDAGRVSLDVRDTGCGMDEETKSRIFDPFFTTKFTGRGLGLAAVAGIARGHKAIMNVTSAPGQGSTFRLLFLAAEAPVATPVEPMHQAAAHRTVLVVDDEDMVRRIAQATLEIHGFQVLLATNGLEAIHKVREHREIDLVLLDLTMPVMGGEEAVDGILAERPSLPVIVSTGYDHREAVARFGRKHVAGYLQKPYSSRQLAEKVKSALAVKASGR